MEKNVFVFKFSPLNCIWKTAFKQCGFVFAKKKERNLFKCLNSNLIWMLKDKPSLYHDNNTYQLIMVRYIPAFKQKKQLSDVHTYIKELVT